MKLRTNTFTRRAFLSTLLATTLAISACGSGEDSSTPTASTAAVTPLTAGAVAAGDHYGSEAAESILKAGGNAVDAAVATALVLAVTYPEAGNLGGGGFMNIYMDKKPYFLDYRETAPGAATSTMYAQYKDANGNQDPNSSLRGAQAVAVPGTVSGLWEAHKKFGKLPWKDVIAPAIALAENGHVVSTQQVHWRDYAEDLFKGAPYPTNTMEYFGAMVPGQNFKQAELAETLKRIATGGADEFYKGKTADLIVAAMKQDGGKGLITKEDLAQYKPVWREPIKFSWNGMTVLTAPPPSSGGIALAQLLGMKAVLADNLFAGESPNTAQYVHLNAEMLKRVYADRAEYLGDPAFTNVPVADLINPDYIKSRAMEVNPSRITPTNIVKPGLAKLHTTHYSVLDKWGNAVSNTYTLNMPYGSGVVVRGAGFALNDEMDDFATIPGQPNIFGVVGSDANAVAPGKRPLSSMTPTILVKGDLPAMVVGTPGGSRIFAAVYQVLANAYDYKMDVKQAVVNRRFHHQLPQGDTIEGEPFSPIPADLAAQLTARGYTVTTRDWDTDVQAIQINGTEPTAAADPRGRGTSIVVR